MGYIDRVKAHIFPLSVEQHDIEKALSEWVAQPVVKEADDADTACEMCEHVPIRWCFLIINALTGNRLWVGSECILKFMISVLTDANEIVTTRSKAAGALRKQKREHLKQAQLQRVASAILALARLEPNWANNLENYLTYYKKHGGFSPRMASVLVWRFNVRKIPFKPNDFKVRTRRDNDCIQLVNLTDTQYQQIRPCLTPVQQVKFDEQRRPEIRQRMLQWQLRQRQYGV